ncbi:VP2 [Rabbit polyomavirus]|nr:VP2 [Rabbit polyomavirus]
MGIILAIPEFIAAVAVGGAEALEIAGGIGALAAGADVAAFAETAAILGETVPITISEAAATVLAQTPEIVEALNVGGQAVGSAVSLGAGFYSAIAGTAPEHQGTHGLTHRADMANALVPYQQVPTFIQWLNNILSYIPSIQQVWGTLQTATATYQMLDEHFREREQQYEQLVTELERGLNSGPVQAVISRVRAAAADREIAVHRITEDVRDVSTNIVSGVTQVGQSMYRAVNSATAAAQNAVQQVQNTVQTIQDTLQNIASSATGSVSSYLTDGYNAMPRGVSNYGSWIFMSGSDGGTPHHSLDYWVVYALEEALKPLNFLQNEKSKRLETYHPDSAVATRGKKRRGRSTSSSACKRRHRSAS